MASRNPGGGSFLPRTFRCRVCGQNKAPAEYSKTQLQKWHNKKRNDVGNRVTPDGIGLSCKEHLNDEQEVRCRGPCDLIKVVGQFSKAQLKKDDPWCIICVEWKMNFDGTKETDNMPGDSAARYEFDGIGGSEEFVQRALSAMSSDEDDDYDEEDSDDDEVIPYPRLNPVVNLVDRLEGYGDEAAAEDITADAVSTAHSTGISYWDDDTRDGRSEFGSGKSARTVTGMQSTIMQSGRMPVGTALASVPERSTSHSQGYTATTRDTASTSMAATPIEFISHINMDHHNSNTQAGQSTGLRENFQTSSSRLSGTRPAQGQTARESVGRGAVTPWNKPTPATPNDRKQYSHNQGTRKENNNKWYKGDNRKVFPDNRARFADRAQGGREAAHDSDSPDEM